MVVSRQNSGQPTGAPGLSDGLCIAVDPSTDPRLAD